MGIIVGRGESKLRCDSLGCSVESEYVSGENDGQRDVEPTMQKRGWQCLSDGKTYCPDHAYGVTPNTCYEAEIKRLHEVVKTLRREITMKDDVLRQKNLELDAIGHVWCSGGCSSGVLRYTDTDADFKLTEEQVSMIERNTIRLRYWFEARRCRISQKSGVKLERCNTCSAGCHDKKLHKKESL